ncbi:MAG: dTDP-4-dehydrorhamnose reductase, partial [Spirochaetes bacterium]
MKRKRIVIFGANGMLGHDLRKVLEKDYDLVLTDIQDGDIRDFSFVEKFLNKNLPSIVINSAAYTDVDGCEKNQKIAMEVNAYGAGNIAKASKKISSWLIHISSDYVFDGKKNLPYKEDDPINPLSIYGKSKALAEE